MEEGMDYQLERDILTKAIKNMHKKGLVYFRSGNLSIRTDDNNILIKPSGRPYESLTAKDLALVDVNGKVLSGEFAPSSETPMHTMVYRSFEHVKAVVHTHSASALVCAITGTEIPIFSLEGLGFGGPIPITEFGIPGSDDIGEKVVKAFNGPPKVTGAILRNHGAITIGNNMAEACMRAELLDKLASIYIRALSFGNVTPITAKQINDIKEHYSKKKK
jgi:L-ribulose-5-phosphate 4-epimerase